MTTVYSIVLTVTDQVLLGSVLTGSPVNLFAAHGPEPWWSSWPWDSSHVQDRQGQVYKDVSCREHMNANCSYGSLLSPFNSCPQALILLRGLLWIMEWLFSVV